MGLGLIGAVGGLGKGLADLGDKYIADDMEAERLARIEEYQIAREGRAETRAIASEGRAETRAIGAEGRANDEWGRRTSISERNKREAEERARRQKLIDETNERNRIAGIINSAVQQDGDTLSVDYDRANQNAVISGDLGLAAEVNRANPRHGDRTGTFSQTAAGAEARMLQLQMQAADRRLADALDSVDTPDRKAAKIREIEQEKAMIRQQHRELTGVDIPEMSTPSAGGGAPKAAVDYLLENKEADPTLIERFREKYGYLPPGV